MSGHASVILRIREDMAQIPLEVPLNESVREIAVSFDPNSRGVDLTLASGAEVSVSVPAAKRPRRACGLCHGKGKEAQNSLFLCTRCKGTGDEPSIIGSAS